MATKRSGDMFDYIDEADHVLVTTNATLRGEGLLVMGAGAAGQAEEMNPELPIVFGEARQRNGAVYGVFVNPRYAEGGIHKIGCFQVKFNWWEKARYELIENSAKQLHYMATNNPDKTFFLNYPGIGHGQLKPTMVWEFIRELPDNVHVWRFDKWPEEGYS